MGRSAAPGSADRFFVLARAQRLWHEGGVAGQAAGEAAIDRGDGVGAGVVAQGAEDSPGEGAGGEDVVDAEFEEVKDDKR